MPIRSGLRLYFDWSSRSLYMYVLCFKNIWLGVVKRNLETWVYLCCAWNSQISISGVLLALPVILGTVSVLFFITWCQYSSACYSATWLVYLLLGLLASRGNWGLDTLWRVQMPKQRHLVPFRVLRTAKKSARAGRGVVDTCIFPGTLQSTSQHLRWPCLLIWE